MPWFPRVNRVKEASPANAPILYQYGAFGKRLPKDGNVDELFKHRRAAISLGYIGLYEVATTFYGGNWEGNPEAKEFTLDIIRAMKALCANWSDEYDYHFSVYSTPSENLTDRLSPHGQGKIWHQSRTLQTRNTIPTLSTMMFVRIQRLLTNWTLRRVIQLRELQAALSITVNIPVLQQNPKALEAVWDYAYDPDSPALSDQSTKLISATNVTLRAILSQPTGLKCPNCGNTDPKTVDVVERTLWLSGQSSGQTHGQWPHKEISARVKHMNGSTIQYPGNADWQRLIKWYNKERLSLMLGLSKLVCNRNEGKRNGKISIRL